MESKKKHTLQKGGIIFYIKQHDIKQTSGTIHLEDEVSPTFWTHNNGVKNAMVNQWWTDKHLFLVQICYDIIRRLDYYSGTSDDTLVNTVWVEKSKKNITSQMTIKILISGMLYFVEGGLGFLHKEVGTYFLWSVFDMEIFLTRVYLKTILIFLWWSIN